MSGEGFTAADDVSPERWFQPEKDGVLADVSIRQK